MTQLSKVQAISDASTHQTNNAKTVVLAGIIGNVIEWYDFALYGYLAPVLSLLFFPNDNEIVSLLETYGVFAAGFIMRPIGAGIFGYIGDRISRRTELFLSVILMAIPTFLLGTLPSYTQIGIAAPILLILLRLVQGLSVGGEFTGSVTYVAETAPQDRRGFITSFVNVGSMMGLLLGLGIVTLMTHILSETSLQIWGWRLPFLFGGVLGLLGLYIRSNLPVSEVFQEHQADSQVSLIASLRPTLGSMLKAMMYAGGYSAVFYLSMVYIPTYLVQYLDVSFGHALFINAVAIAIQISLLPLMGWLSDKTLRRKSWLLISTISLALAGIPAFWLLSQSNSIAGIWCAQVGLAILVAPLLAISPAMMVELFPTETRLTSYSLAFNIGVSIVGGTSLLVCTWLIDVSGNIYAPGLYLMACALVSTLAIALMSDRSREPLL